jgi:hypothetical protein
MYVVRLGTKTLEADHVGVAGVFVRVKQNNVHILRHSYF